MLCRFKCSESDIQDHRTWGENGCTVNRKEQKVEMKNFVLQFRFLMFDLFPFQQGCVFVRVG